MEGTARFAVTAGNAGVGFQRELLIMPCGHLIASQSKIIIFIDQTDINTARTGLTMVAVDADAFGVGWCESADRGIVPFLSGGVQISEDIGKICPVANTRKYSQYSRTIQGILNALDTGELLFEGGGLGIQKLSSAKGLHYGDADSFSLAFPVEAAAVGVGADSISSGGIIVGGIDTEHHHINTARVQKAPDDFGIVRREAQMADDAVLL